MKQLRSSKKQVLSLGLLALAALHAPSSASAQVLIGGADHGPLVVRTGPGDFAYGDLSIGDNTFSLGEFQALNAAKVSFSNAYVHHGTVRASGVGTQIDVTGYTQIGAWGGLWGGLLDVNSGAEFNAKKWMAIGGNKPGTAYVNAGTLNAGESLTIGHEAGVIGSLDASGGSIISVKGGLDVGWSGSGSAIFSKGSQVSSDVILHMAANKGSSGSVKVTDAGTQLNAGKWMLIGDAGKASLTVENQATAAATDHIRLGAQAGSVGSLTIDSKAQVTSGGFVQVGDAGEGHLLVKNGGSLNAVGGLQVANLAGSLGTVEITDADSMMSVNDGFSVGTQGNGTLTVTNQASFQSKGYGAVGNYGQGVVNISMGGSMTQDGFMAIGLSTGGVGFVQVEGAGSSFSVSDSNAVDVGFMGKGTLQVLNGAKAEMGSFVGIGTRAGSAGSSVLVGSGALLKTGTMVVGGTEKSSLAIDGGTVELAEWLNAHSNGEGSIKVTNAGKLQVGLGAAVGGATNQGSIQLDKGSGMSVTKSFIIGYQGDGTTTLETGAALDVGENLFVGFGSSQGHLDINDSQVSVQGELHLGPDKESAGNVNLHSGQLKAGDSTISHADATNQSRLDALASTIELGKTSLLSKAVVNLENTDFKATNVKLSSGAQMEVLHNQADGSFAGGAISNEGSLSFEIRSQGGGNATLQLDADIDNHGKLFLRTQGTTSIVQSGGITNHSGAELEISVGTSLNEVQSNSVEVQGGLHNQAGGKMTISNLSTLGPASALSVNATIHNSGETVISTVGGTSITLQDRFTNHGSLEVYSNPGSKGQGLVSFNGGLDNFGTYVQDPVTTKFLDVLNQGSFAAGAGDEVHVTNAFLNNGTLKFEDALLRTGGGLFNEGLVDVYGDSRFITDIQGSGRFVYHVRSFDDLLRIDGNFTGIFDLFFDFNYDLLKGDRFVYFDEGATFTELYINGVSQGSRDFQGGGFLTSLGLFERQSVPEGGHSLPMLAFSLFILSGSRLRRLVCRRG